MNIHRRQFLAAAVASASSLARPRPAGASAGALDFSAVRGEFPRAERGVYLDTASSHPLSRKAAEAMHRYTDWLTYEVGAPWWPSWAEARDQVKPMFAKLINAKPSEIAFARSTMMAENMLLNEMDIQGAGGNVVTNDLHYVSCLHNYKMRQQAGLDVRIVQHRDWQIDIRDLEKVVDRNTKLIAIALVSNVNGYLHDVKAISELAHAHGAYVYADIIQCAGAIPIDVKAMGIDFAACSTYKWLMGVKGFAFRYIREDLQGTITKPVLFGGGVRFNYPPWTPSPEPGQGDIVFKPRAGISRYELGYPSFIAVICALESFKYIQQLGIDNIRAHSRSLTSRLQRELPPIGYASITPKDNESPIVSFTLRNPEKTRETLKKARVEAPIRFGNRLRLSPSVFNNHEDIDRLLDVLS